MSRSRDIADFVAEITDGTDTVETGYVINGSAKGWCNFNGQGTIATRNSLNSSSLTDDGTGTYQVALTTSFATADWVGSVFCQQDDTHTVGSSYMDNAMLYKTQVTGELFIYTNGQMSNTGRTDCKYVLASATGDLA